MVMVWGGVSVPAYTDMVNENLYKTDFLKQHIVLFDHWQHIYKRTILKFILLRFFKIF